MALKVKAVERKIKFTKDENDPGVWRYVMQPDLYIALNQAKVIRSHWDRYLGMMTAMTQVPMTTSKRDQKLK